MRELISEAQIQAKVEELAAQINSDYGTQPLEIVCILKGAMIFGSDLVRRLKMPVRIHLIHISSYEDGKESSGTVSIHFSSSSEYRNLHVLVIEDILDTGLTLEFVMEHLRQQLPASLKSCVLLNKPSRRRVRIEANYTGFVIEDQFVVGYGLDFNEQYRNLPYIAVMDS